MKYSGDSKTVWIDARRRDRRVAIRVRDEGIGIPRDDQQEIFRKFKRGRNAKHLSVKGTGIGLAMVQHIVDAHGGSVELNSEPGSGSEFTILLRTKDEA